MIHTTFKPIDLNNAFELALSLTYRIDADAANGVSDIDVQAHFAQLTRRTSQHPQNVAFAMLGNDPVGIFIGGGWSKDQNTGYINLIYLRADARGKGQGAALLAAAENYLSEHGFSTARLTSDTATVSNTDFYKRNGWHPIGPHPDCADKTLWEKTLTHA